MSDPAFLAVVDQIQAEIITKAREGWVTYCDLNPDAAVELNEEDVLIMEIGIKLGMNAAVVYMHQHWLIKPREVGP